MPIEKVKSEFEKLTEILDKEPIADECTAGELKKVHDQFQEAIKSGDPARLRDKKLTQQLVLLEESNPAVGKVIKDIMNALSGMGI